MTNKIGYLIDSKIQEANTKKRSKDLANAAEYEKIYERLRNLSSETSDEVSTRVKLLIKNMFDHRN